MLRVVSGSDQSMGSPLYRRVCVFSCSVVISGQISAGISTGFRLLCTVFGTVQVQRLFFLRRCYSGVPAVPVFGCLSRDCTSCFSLGGFGFLIQAWPLGSLSWVYQFLVSFFFFLWTSQVVVVTHLGLPVLYFSRPPCYNLFWETAFNNIICRFRKERKKNFSCGL